MRRTCGKTLAGTIERCFEFTRSWRISLARKLRLRVRQGLWRPGPLDLHCKGEDEGIKIRNVVCDTALRLHSFSLLLAYRTRERGRLLTHGCTQYYAGACGP